MSADADMEMAGSADESQTDDDTPTGVMNYWFYPELDDSGTAEWEEVKQPFIMHPDCTFRRWWELLSMILIVYSCITIPYRVAFAIEVPAGTLDFYVDKIVDSIFMVDCVMTFRIAIRLGDHLITDQPTLAVQYFKGWFIPDFSSSFPFDMLLGGAGEGGEMNPETARLLKIIRIFRMVKILRMVRIKRLLKKLQDDLGIKNGIMISIKFCLFVVVVSHFGACMWWSQASTPGHGYASDNNWALGYCIKSSNDHFDADCGDVSGILTCQQSCATQMGEGFDANGVWKDIVTNVFKHDRDFKHGDTEYWAPYGWDSEVRDALIMKLSMAIQGLGVTPGDAAQPFDPDAPEISEVKRKYESGEYSFQVAPGEWTEVGVADVNGTRSATISDDITWMRLLGGGCVATCQEAVIARDGIKLSSQYKSAFYWSIVTLTTLGYGDITPANHGERGFCTVAMLMGASIFAYSVTNMCTLVHNLNPAAVFFRTRRDELNDYLEFLKTPKSLRQRVQDYYNFKVTRSDTVVYNQDLILRDMSKTMQEDVKFFILEELLQAIPFFATEYTAHPKTIQEKENKRYLAAIAVQLEGYTMAPTEKVVTQGDIATKMFIVGRGVVVCKKDGVEGVVETLADGSVFGVGSLFRPTKYGYTVIVEEYVDLYTLSKYDFIEVLVVFNKDKGAIEAVAEEAGMTEKDLDEKLGDGSVGPKEEDVTAKIAFLRAQIKMQASYISVMSASVDPPGSLD